MSVWILKNAASSDFPVTIASIYPVRSGEDRTRNPMFSHPTLDRFRELCSGDEPPLFEGALLFAEGLCCPFDADKARAEMDRLESNLREKIGQTAEPLMQLRIFSRYLGEEEGFTGNRERYYETDNSFMPRVLENKKGIPISLSIIAIELGRRLGLPIQGVGLPGHFICAYAAPGKTYYFDPFHQWRTISRHEAEQMILRLFGEDFEVTEACFTPWTNRLMLDRSLRNLKSVYLSRGDLESALKAVEYILAVMPGQSHEIRDRGIIRSRLGKYGLAYEDLLQYLAQTPEAPDAEQVQRELVRVKKELEQLN